MAALLTSKDTTTVSRGPATALENQATGIQSQGLTQLQNLIGQGPGAQDVTAGLTATRDLATQLEALAKTGGMPTAEDITQQEQLAGRLFAGRRQALQSSFLDQQQQYSQQAALQGRNPLDVVFRNKQAQAQEQALGQLGAEQSVFATQQAMEQPFQRFNLAQQRAGILQGLATQAMANRQALIGLGSNIGSQQASLRDSISTKESFDPIGGAIKGLTAAVGIGGGFSNMFGSTGITGPTTTPKTGGGKISNLGASSYSDGAQYSAPIGPMPQPAPAFTGPYSQAYYGQQMFNQNPSPYRRQ